MKRVLALVLLLVLSGALAFAPALTTRAFSSPQDLPSPAAVVKPRAYVSLEPVPRGKEFQIAVVADIAKGFHMNSPKQRI
jgi:hypothetical protein